jgi:hypothetical protein
MAGLGLNPRFQVRWHVASGLVNGLELAIEWSEVGNRGVAGKGVVGTIVLSDGR